MDAACFLWKISLILGWPSSLAASTTFYPSSNKGTISHALGGSTVASLRMRPINSIPHLKPVNVSTRKEDRSTLLLAINPPC